MRMPVMAMLIASQYQSLQEHVFIATEIENINTPLRHYICLLKLLSHT